MEKREDMWLWLCSIPGLYRPHIRALLEYFETPETVFDLKEQELLKCPLLTPKQKEEIVRSKKSWDGQKEWYALKKKGILFINCEQEQYPARLKQIYDYPYGLFCKGRLPREEKPAAAVVGARLCSGYGRHWAAEIAGQLAARGVEIVSGMARGIDSAAQSAALDAGGSSYAVLGSGVDICYPRENSPLYRRIEEEGGVISEYPPGTPPNAWHFPMRNRIISGLSDIVVVAEAKEKSGSLITADLALEQGRDVIAVPGRAGDVINAGCNRLIEQGAGIFISVEQLAERMNMQQFSCPDVKKTNIILETRENLVYSVLEFRAKNLQSIADETGLAPETAGALLVRLMLKGLIMETAKNYYARV